MVGAWIVDWEVHSLKKLTISVYAGIVFLLFSLVFFYQSLEFPYTSDLGGPGSGFFPLWLSGILLVLSIIYIYESVKKEKTEEESLPKGKALRDILFILSSMIVFLVILPFLGFVLSGTLFLFILLYREYRWHLNLGISVGVSLFLFWLFGSTLGVSLPVNVLGF